MAENKKNIVGFKKFTDLKSKSKIEEVDLSSDIAPETDFDRPMNPNLPEDTKKGERFASRKNIIPQDQNVDTDEDSDDFSDDIDYEIFKKFENKNLVLKKIYDVFKSFF
jgi:Sec7-like guanine-nucleotide exchange factor